MEQSVVEQPAALQEATEEILPEYEPPRVITYSGDEIVARLGPAQACDSYLGAVFPACQ